MNNFHEAIIRGEFLFIQAVGSPVITEQAYLPQIFRHDYEHTTVFRLLIELLMDDGQYTLVLATRIMKITQIIKSVQTVYTQHRTSKFSTKRFKPS